MAARRGDGPARARRLGQRRAAIAPWYRYGHFRESVVAGQLIAFQPGDFFVSTKSGLDAVLGGGRHLAVKDVLARLSKAAGFEAIDEAIAERLARGQHVFVYNFVPGAFTLLGLNHAAARRGDPPLTGLDFEAFMAALGQRHELAPAADYWEEGKAPLYLFGERTETMWEIRPRRGAGPSPRRSEQAPS